MALFENFPYTNLHELNLDWLIQEMENLKELVQDGPVISVNGQTGVVTLYQEAQVQLPDITDSQQTYWNIFRYLNGHIYGIRFDSNGNVYAIRDGVRTKLLTWADIPADAGVISVNGLYGVVHISGTDIPWMGGENETVFDKLSDNEDAIAELNIVLGTLTNAIKAGIAYLEPNVDDTAIHNIPAGKYVFWKNYAYKTTQAISIGDTLSSTNLQAVVEGGFINALQAELGKYLSTGEASDFATAWTYALTNKITAVHISSGASDAPTNVGEWDCLQGGSGDYGWQLAIESNSDVIYYRRRFTGVFTTWESFALNSVIGVVPSGQTVEGQIASIDTKVTNIINPSSQENIGAVSDNTAIDTEYTFSPEVQLINFMVYYAGNLYGGATAEIHRKNTIDEAIVFFAGEDNGTIIKMAFSVNWNNNKLILRQNDLPSQYWACNIIGWK